MSSVCPFKSTFTSSCGLEAGLCRLNQQSCLGLWLLPRGSLTSPQRVERSAAGVFRPQLHPCGCMSWQPISLKGSSHILEVRGQKSVLWGYNPGLSRAVFLLEILGKNLLCPFPASWSCPHSFGSWQHITLTSDACVTSPSLLWTLLPLSVLYMNPVITVGPSG